MATRTRGMAQMFNNNNRRNDLESSLLHRTQPEKKNACFSIAATDNNTRKQSTPSPQTIMLGIVKIAKGSVQNLMSRGWRHTCTRLEPRPIIWWLISRILVLAPISTIARVIVSVRIWPSVVCWLILSVHRLNLPACDVIGIIVVVCA